MAHVLPRQASRSRASAAWLDWVVALVLLLAALPIALYRLDAQSLWLDEGTTQAYVTSRHIGALLVDLFRPDAVYPLYHLLVKVTVRLLGDSEWALRLPSAIAGSLSVSALYLLGAELRSRVTGIAAAALLLIAPFGLRLAQDAKAYSLALLLTIVLALFLARALRLGTRRAWLLWGLAALTALFVHRLLVLSVLGCGFCWALLVPQRQRGRILLALLGASVLLIGATAATLWYQGAGVQFNRVGPLQALSRSFAQFAVGQYRGDVPWFWLAPFALLAVLGGVHWLADLRHAWFLRDDPVRGDEAAVRRARGAVLLLCMSGVPAVLFLVLLTVSGLYEERYLAGLYPFWLLLLGWGLPVDGLARSTVRRRGFAVTIAGAGLVVLCVALLVEQHALVLPRKGIFSGDPIKEDYRKAVTYLAQHVHPDDLVIVYPDAIKPLYNYYARRVTTHPLPQAVSYGKLGRAEGFKRRELEVELLGDFSRHKRAWLMIAPEHARIVDRPEEGDELGLVGLAFQYGDQNRRIQCGPPPYAGFVGVRVYCNNLPEIGGKVPQPRVRTDVVFGDQLRLHGYTVTPFPSGPKPGSTLPVTLFWEPLANLEGTDYQVFVHLTTLDHPKPVVQADGRPMEGGQPTARWTKPNVLLHDDRSIPLPGDLAPGRYLLRVGVYRVDDGARLRAETTLPTLDDAVVVGEVEIRAP